MISVSNVANVYDLRGISADLDKLKEQAAAGELTKIGNGSTFLNMDDSTVWAFDKENMEWKEL